MDFADISPWLSLGPTGALTGYLIRDNLRLRRENKEQAEQIDEERRLRHAAEDQSAKFAAEVGGLKVQVAYLTAQLQRAGIIPAGQPPTEADNDVT